MRIPFPGAALALACAMPVSAFAQTAGFGFDPYEILPGAPGLLAVGDVDGDSRDDLVVTRSNNDGVRIYKQLSNGTLGPAQDVIVTSALQGKLAPPLLTDLDGDGVAEIVLGYSRDLQGQPGNGIAILRRNGNGGYSVQTYPQVERNVQMAAMDVNLDGKMDIVTLSQNEGMRIHYGNGAGGVQSTGWIQQALWQVDARELRVADVNGDGYDDIVVNLGVSTITPDIAVHLHDGAFGFLPAVTYSVPGNEYLADGLAVGDFTGDGLSDVLTGRNGGSSPSLWLFAQNAGTLQTPPAEVPTTSAYGAMVAVDLDRDGRVDAVKMHSGLFRLGYFLGSSTGLLAETQTDVLPPATRYLPGQVAFGDLNGDGCTDAVVSSIYTQIVGAGVQTLSLNKGHGCAANADLAAAISNDADAGVVTASVAHRGGIAVNDASVAVWLRLSSRTVKVDVPPECAEQPVRNPPIKRPPQPVSRLYLCTIGDLALGDRRDFAFGSEPGTALSASADAGSAVFDPNPGNNSVDVEF